MSSKKLFIQINGGLGKNISFTGVAKLLKETKYFDKIYVSSPYWDVFEACPYIDGVYKPNEARDFIFDAKDETARLIIDNMYQTEDFIYKKASYESAWLKMIKQEDNYSPSCSAVKAELDNALVKYPHLQSTIDAFNNAIKEKGFKDYVIMQFTGGQSPLTQPPVVEGKPDWSKLPYNYDNEPLKRHYPKEKAQEFVDLFVKAHPKTAILMYQLPNEPCPDSSNIVRMTAPYLAYYELAKKAKGVVSIDSSLQHLTAGKCKAVVLWGHSLPDAFGYSYNCNILQSCRRDDILYFTALGASGAKIDYIEPKELLSKVDEYLFETDNGIRTKDSERTA